MPFLPVVVSDEAGRMIAALDAHYEARKRIEAQAAIAEALSEAVARIAAEEGPFYNAPVLDPRHRRAHPLRRYGWTWLLARRYWFAFESESHRHIIAAMFHETSLGIGPVRRSR